MSDSNAQRVGTTIRELREIRGWSQNDLAQRSGCRSSSICHCGTVVRADANSHACRWRYLVKTDQ